MARIRSIHPGLFTDEAFMSASPYARLLIFGIWCEAWDDGVFEWKPLTLKARIFPVDVVDVAAVLSELAALNVISPFRANGKDYGAVRNFQKYQRPKKPNSSKVLPDELRLYVRGSETGTELGSEPVTPSDDTSSENSPQREDGGWREGEENNNQQQRPEPALAAAATPSVDEKEVERRCVQATGWTGKMGGISAILDLMGEGFSLEGRILPVLRMLAADVRNRGDKPPGTWAYAIKPVRDASRKPGGGAAQETKVVFVEHGSPEWEALARIKGPNMPRPVPSKQAGDRFGTWVAADSLPTGIAA